MFGRKVDLPTPPQIMDNNGENESLLMKEYYSRNEQYVGGSSSSSRGSSNPVGDWWNESGTETVSSGSSYSDSDYDGSLYEWEAEIDTRGELFFVESVRTSDSKDTSVCITAKREHTREFTSTHGNLRSTKGKLAKLIKQRSSKHFRGKHAKASQAADQGESSTTQENSSNKVTFQDWQQGEVREVTLPVNGRVAHNLGRRATLSEMSLGLTTSKFTDGIRIMVAGFIPNGEAAKHCGIKIGDWLQSINGHEVNGQTFDAVLSALKPPCEVTLRLQRVAGCEVTVDEYRDSTTKVHWQSKFVRRLKGVDPPPTMVGQPVLALFLSGAEETPSQPEESEHNHRLLYCFPAQSPASPLDVIVAARGAFITLCHLFPNAGASAPVSSSAVVNGELIHILYSSQDGLLLLAVPDKRCPMWEAKRLLSDIVDNLEFCYKTLQRAFSDESNHQSLDQFFTLTFMRLLTDGSWPATSMSLVLHDEGPHTVTAKFEELLPIAPWLAMPQHIQVQIDTVLSRLEANDFVDVNDDPDCQQRLYSIIGSCYYHKGYLLSWHAEKAFFLRTHLFLRQHGVLELIHREPVQSLLLWREVFPIITAPSGARHFLLCAGKGHDLLAILCEAGGCSMLTERNPGPDVCYVDAAHLTLDYIEKSGISSVVSKWLSANRRPQVNTQDADLSSRTYRNTENLLGFVKQLDTLASAKSSGSTASSSLSPKKHPEVTSILKRRNSPERNYGYMSSGVSIQGSTSEDSASQAASVMSEMSDESAPILGRRAERERITRRGSVDRFSESLSEQSEESESDWEGQGNDGGPYDLSTISKAIALEVEDLRPSKLTSGQENVLFHFVDLNICEGVLLSSLPTGNREDSQKMQEIIRNFKLSCQAIHDLLQNTVSFKRLMTQELNKGLINRSLVAIKECGMLFEVNNQQSQTGKKSTSPVSYWVVGRLFSTPHPREVYVCYEDCASQNMVEIAFRLALNAAG